MFKDKVYEEMDEVERMFEPIISKENEFLSKLPDKIEITAEHMASVSFSYYSKSLGVDSVIRREIDRLGLDAEYEKVENRINFRDFYEFETDSKKLQFNTKTGELTGEIFLVRSKIAYTDEEIMKSLKYKLERLDGHFWRAADVSKKRVNELGDLFGFKDIRKERKYKLKIRKYSRHLLNLVESKELDIKDVDLFNRFVRWNILYMSNGNLAALNNLTKIKILMHQKRPIYSIEELQC